MSFEEYVDHDGLGLVELIEQREVSPKEVLEAAMLTAESVNPVLNAIVTPLYDDALVRIANGGIQGPLAYVPFLLKDVHHALEGTPMSNGSALQQGERSRRHAEIVERWLAAGLIPIGKTNTPEYKTSPTTNPEIWGPTRNPWDVARTPGGSSGGSAAAVAAGIVPLASATDEAGSIRMPAANCGVFGLKPSRGRNPIGPDFRWKLAGLSTSHVISRSVRDSAAALDASSGPEPGSPYECPEERGFLAALSERPPKLRVGLGFESRALGRPVEPEVLHAIAHAGKVLTDLGHEVEEVKLPFDERDAMRLAVILIAASFAEFADELGREYGTAAVRDGLEPINRFIWRVGGAMPRSFRDKAQSEADALGRTLAEFHAGHDVLVTSTLCCAPKLIEDTDPTPTDLRLAKLLSAMPLRPLMALPGLPARIVDSQLEALIDRVPYRTSLANLTGQPAMSVPLQWTANELPIGIQFLGPFGSEKMLLQLAAQLEAAQPWAGRLPTRRVEL